MDYPNTDRTFFSICAALTASCRFTTSGCTYLKNTYSNSNRYWNGCQDQRMIPGSHFFQNQRLLASGVLGIVLLWTKRRMSPFTQGDRVVQASHQPVLTQTRRPVWADGTIIPHLVQVPSPIQGPNGPKSFSPLSTIDRFPKRICAARYFIAKGSTSSPAFSIRHLLNFRDNSSISVDVLIACIRFSSLRFKLWYLFLMLLSLLPRNVEDIIDHLEPSLRCKRNINASSTADHFESFKLGFR